MSTIDSENNIKSAPEAQPKVRRKSAKAAKKAPSAKKTSGGASRWRLISQFFAEGVVLVAAGNVLGLVATAWVIQLLTRLVPLDLMDGLPFLVGLGLNLRVAMFALGVSLVETMIFVLPPALHLSFTTGRGGLTQSGRWSTGGSWRRLGSKLVALELTNAMVLLVSAGLLGQSVQRLLRVQLGFQPDHLETLMVAVPADHYSKFAQVVGFVRTLVSELERLSGAKSAALASLLPVGFNGNTEWIRIVDHPFHGEHWEVNMRQVSSEYFTTLGAKLVRGRAFGQPVQHFRRYHEITCTTTAQDTGERAPSRTLGRKRC